MRQIVLDTETTGLEADMGHRIIEIGAVEVVNRRLTGRHFHKYLNPERDIDDGAFEVHGLSRDFLSDKPRFEEVCEEFLDFVQDAELIIHNAPFDVSFIDYEFKLLGRQRRGQAQRIARLCKVTDSLAVARKKHPGQKNNLDALCRRYEVDNSQRQLHGALLDAEILADVYLLMTGGQTTLFGSSVGLGDQMANTELERVQERTTEFTDVEVVVIEASHADQIAHDAYLKFLRGQCGGEPVWSSS